MMPRISFILFLILCLAPAASAEPAGQAVPAKLYTVNRVVDGDTLALTNDERVKLIGIDSPEAINGLKLHRDARQMGIQSSAMKGMGLQSKKFTANLVEGRKIRLEYEGSPRDRNGRIRAHAFLEDGTFVNAEILRQGYATVVDQPSLKYGEFFQEMQREAMYAERGLWKFIEDREIQLITNEYKNLSEIQRQEVLEYIGKLKNGEIAPEPASEPETREPEVSAQAIPEKSSHHEKKTTAYWLPGVAS